MRRYDYAASSAEERTSDLIEQIDNYMQTSYNSNHKHSIKLCVIDFN